MRAKSLPLGALVLAAAACLGPGDITGDDGDAHLIGTIVVVTVTTGATSDPDGYSASVNEAISAHIDVNGTVTFGGVPVGTHTVLISGIDGTCVATTPNPVHVVMLADSTVTTQFEINCP